MVCSHCYLHFPPLKSLFLQTQWQYMASGGFIQLCLSSPAAEQPHPPEKSTLRHCERYEYHTLHNIPFVTEICWCFRFLKAFRSINLIPERNQAPDCLWRSRPVSWPKKLVVNAFRQMWHFTGRTSAGTSFSVYIISRLTPAPHCHHPLRPQLN